MGSGIEFTIKLKPYLQEWVFNSVMKEPPKATLDDMFGYTIFPYLRKYEEDTNPKFYKGPEYFRFEMVNINDKGLNLKDGKYVIPDKYHKHIERLLYLIFEREFISHIDDKVRYGENENKRGRYNGRIQRCIMQWCVDKSLTYDSITYEMLKKKYYRYRQKLNIKDCKRLSLKNMLIF